MQCDCVLSKTCDNWQCLATYASLMEKTMYWKRSRELNEHLHCCWWWVEDRSRQAIGFFVHYKFQFINLKRKCRKLKREKERSEMRIISTTWPNKWYLNHSFVIICGAFIFICLVFVRLFVCVCQSVYFFTYECIENCWHEFLLFIVARVWVFDP